MNKEEMPKSQAEMLSESFEKIRKNKIACSDGNGGIQERYRKAFCKMDEKVRNDAMHYLVMTVTAYLTYLKDGEYVPYIDTKSFHDTCDPLMPNVREAINAYDDKKLIALADVLKSAYIERVWSDFVKACEEGNREYQAA